MDWVISLGHWFGSAVCGQIPADTYYIAGVPLPLCARCTGMYVGALSTILFSAWRHPRAVGLPRPWVLVILFLFFLSWGADGLNSVLSSMPPLPHLYQPHNILRLTTGTLMGISLGSLIFVLFNSVIWRNATRSAIIASPYELLALLGVGALLVLAVQSGWELLLYPLTVVSLAAILVLNSALMSAIAGSIVGKLAFTWREARNRLLAGSLIALTFLDLLALARLWLFAYLGVPT